MTKKKEKEEVVAPKKSLEEMILNYPSGKYSAIPLAAMWAKVLRRRDEHRALTQNEVLELALKNVLEGVVDWKDVKKAMADQPAEPVDALSALKK